MTGLEGLRAHMVEAIEAMKKHEGNVQLYHHNDADGLSSGAILISAFESAGFSIEKRAVFEKPYPHILKSIVCEQENKIIVFADFCGRIADHIAELNASSTGGRNLVIILDHHVTSHPSDKVRGVFNLDCDLFGLRGDHDMTASVVCFVFAQELLKAYDCSDVEKEKDMSVLALVGAVGDGFYDENGRLAGVSDQVFSMAAEHGLCSYDSTDYVNTHGESLKAFASDLDVLGGIGLSQGGPALAIDFLIRSPRACSIAADDSLLKRIHDLTELKQITFKKAMNSLDLAPVSDSNVVFVDVKDSFGTMGVKMIGVFLTELSKLPQFTDMYLIGSQNLPEKIPGFEHVTCDTSSQVKISARAGARQCERIRSGRAVPLDILLPNASRFVNGFSDACHPTAAAVVILADQLSSFRHHIDRILDGGAVIGAGYGYGKTILCGGDCGFLMWGVNAIVGALPFESVCLVEPLFRGIANEYGFIEDDKRVEVPGYKLQKQHQSLDAIIMILKHLKIDERVKNEPIRITFRGSLRAASGNGSSAAYCVSLSRALNFAFALGLDNYQINHAGWIGEHAFHGKPSGVDNTVSTFGGLIDIRFDVATQKSEFEAVHAESVEIVLAHSGVEMSGEGDMR